MFFPYVLGVLLLSSSPSNELPVGSHPAALTAEHFPDRLHAFVFRNWHLVSPQRMAEVVGTSTEDIVSIAQSMGLPEARSIPAEFHERMYITVLRRNWHLLPYPQLLILLDMNSDELAHRLKEDDFLFIKLGNLKPKVEPLRFKPPTKATQERAAQIRKVVHHHFGNALRDAGTPRLQFLRDLAVPHQSHPRNPPNHSSPRFLHSYCALFGDVLMDDKSDPFPEGLLSRLAELGVNGLWLHVTLAELAPGGADFPEFGIGHEKRLANLRKLAAKTKRYGIEIYLYLNEPRARSRSFFAERPEMAGVASQDFVCMCTSDHRVIRWLEQATAHVFRAVPELAGVFTITASENQTNCAWAGNASTCPRCRNRTQAAIVAEVNGAIEKGVHSIKPEAKVIVWDWGWNYHRDGSEHIKAHQGKFWFQSVSEWDTPFERAGVKGKVGEYCLSVVGPGPRALKHWELARKLGHKTSAKVQLGTTWELGSVPWLPVGDLVAEHCLKLKAAGTEGLMLSWSHGGYPSPNLRIAQKILDEKQTDHETIVQEVCRELYGDKAGPRVRMAWKKFSKAFQHYPYCGSVIYNGPQHFGPAQPLYAKPTGYHATMIGFPYDDVATWRGPYTSEQMASQFEKLVDEWKQGEKDLLDAAQSAEQPLRTVLQSERELSTAIRLHLQSAACQIRFYQWRDKPVASLTAEELHVRKVQLLQLVEKERELAKELYPIVKHDSRIGFESSNQYYYVPLDLVEKVILCDWLLETLK